MKKEKKNRKGIIKEKKQKILMFFPSFFQLLGKRVETI